MGAHITSDRLAAHAEINDLFNKPTNGIATKNRILELLEQSDLPQDDDADLVLPAALRRRKLSHGLERIAPPRYNSVRG